MTPSRDPAAASPHAGMSFTQFVALMAALMATNALAIDTMLPALPVIGDAIGITTENHRQWIVTAYLLGFGGAQIFYGTLADRYGRRPVLLFGLALYAASSAMAALAGSLEMMIATRVLQGVGAAATRVLAISIVRDCYAGRQMARVMSLTFIVFLAVPIFAPSIGQLIMLVAPWPAIFLSLAVFGTLVMAWAALSLPETLHPEDRLTIAPGRIVQAFRIALTNRQAVGYMLATTLVIGALFGYINSVQQLFADVFHRPHLFPIVFGFTAVFIAISSLLNSRIVERLGMHRVSHTALLGYVAVAVLHACAAWAGYESLWLFVLLQSMMMFCFGLVASNFGAMAMEPLGHIAGTASSVQGFVTTFGGALLGFMVGQHFDGTARPMTTGFAVLGLGALAIVLATERGRLFRSTPAGTAGVRALAA